MSGAALAPGAAPQRIGGAAAQRIVSRLALRYDADPAFRATLDEIGTNLATALALHRSGDTEGAASNYRAVLQTLPLHPRALHMSGVIELQRGNVAAAIALIERSLQVQPEASEAWVNLGSAFRLAGRAADAVAACRQAIAVKPDMALAHAQLAELLTEEGHVEAAITHHQTVVSIDPSSIPARIQLALALRRAGRRHEATCCWAEVIERGPTRAESFHVLGQQFGDANQWSEALKCQQRACRLQPGQPRYHCACGVAFIHLNDAEASVACFRQAIDLEPGSKEALAGLGWAMRLLGRFEAAETWFQQLRDLDPTDARAYQHLATDGDPGDPRLEQQLAAILQRRESSVDDRITAGFSLGRWLHNRDRHDEAFAQFATVNALVRQAWPAGADRFDAAAFSASIDRLIERHPLSGGAASGREGNLSQMPVFVVGMPRSGTTLVEQICASHSRVFGAGELADLSRIATTAGADPGTGAGVIDAAELRRLANLHVVKLHKLGGGAIRVVDKMPDNVLLVGLLATMFPRARIVYCSRDARDLALSCFFQLFNAGAQHFSYDLADCGHRAREVQRLAAHWLRLLPDRMIEVNYGALVSDLEGQSRRLIGFLDLDWEPACVDFHRTERTVATVSHWQVRQPIYQSSVGQWHHYAAHLAPLLAALGQT